MIKSHCRTSTLHNQFRLLFESLCFSLLLSFTLTLILSFCLRHYRSGYRFVVVVVASFFHIEPNSKVIFQYLTAVSRSIPIIIVFNEHLLTTHHLYGKYILFKFIKLFKLFTLFNIFAWVNQRNFISAKWYECARAHIIIIREDRSCWRVRSHSWAVQPNAAC